MIDTTPTLRAQAIDSASVAVASNVSTEIPTFTLPGDGKSAAFARWCQRNGITLRWEWSEEEKKAVIHSTIIGKPGTDEAYCVGLYVAASKWI